MAAGCGETLSPDQRVARAEELRAKGDAAAATVELKGALATAPDHVRARLLLGKVYLDAGDAAAAEKEVGRAVELGLDPGQALVPLTWAAALQGKHEAVAQGAINDPSGPPGLAPVERAELFALRGHAYLELDRAETAGKLYAESLLLAPGNPEAVIGQARLAAYGGDPDSARELLEALVRQRPDYGPAWSVLGAVRREAGDPKGALLAFDRAVSTQYRSLRDHFQRALLRIDAGDFEGAQADLAVLRARATRDPRTGFGQGLVAFRQRRFSDAVGHFQESLKYDADYPPSVFFLGATQFALGNFAQAEEYLGRYLRAHPDAGPPARLLALARLVRGDYAGAERVLAPLLAANPSDPELLTLLSDVVIPQGRQAEGIDYLQKVVAAEQDSADSRLRLGLGLLRVGRREEGVKALEEAGRLDPGLVQAEQQAVLAHLRAKEFDQAAAGARSLQAKQPNDPVAHNLLGLALVGKGQDREGAAAFRRALALSPGWVPATHNLALLAVRRGDLQEALTLYDEALRRRPDDLELVVPAAEVEARLGRLDAARQRLERAVQQAPQRLAPRVALARFHIQSGQPEGALGVLREVSARYSGNPELLLVLGNAQLAARQPAGAAQTFEGLIRAQPKSAEAQYWLGRALAELSDVSGTRRALEAALALDPDYLPAKSALIGLLAREGQTERASALLQELKSKYPDEPSLLVYEGEVAMAARRPRDAAAIYQKALAGRPDDRQLVLRVSQARFAAGDTEAALEGLRDWLSTHPADTVVRYALGEAYLARGRNADAAGAFARLLELAPDSVLALNNLAWSLKDSDPKKALGYAERALAKEPGNPAVLDTVAAVHLKLGDLAKAVRLYREAVQKAPADTALQLRYAEALLQAGQPAEARPLLESLAVGGEGAAERPRAQALLKQLEARP
jgi:putative PEP-CTERM system TPR-repeat lipoprotein